VAAVKRPAKLLDLKLEMGDQRPRADVHRLGASCDRLGFHACGSLGEDQEITSRRETFELGVWSSPPRRIMQDGTRRRNTLQFAFGWLRMRSIKALMRSVLVGCRLLTSVSCTASTRTGASVPSMAAFLPATFRQIGPTEFSNRGGQGLAWALSAATRANPRSVVGRLRRRLNVRHQHQT
jgi:hypothetical protein